MLISWYSESLRTGQSRDKIRGGGGFSTTVQPGPEAHPASYTIGSGSFPRVKRAGSGAYHPPISGTEIEGRVELNICSTLDFRGMF